MKKLAGRVALVTGGANGIGREIVALFAEHGAAVVIGDIDGLQASQTAAELNAVGHKVLARRCDVSRQDEVESLVRSVAEWGNGLDIVVHNAGVFPQSSLGDLSDEDLQRTIATNLTALFWLARQSIPDLKRSRAGRFLVTSSVAGNKSGLARLTHYGATKAGVNGFIRCAAVELGPSGITVNGVEPGLVRTERFALLDQTVERIETTIPLGRLGRPTDIAHAMLFLASDDAAWITGQTIVVDGGGSLPHPSNFTSPAGN